MNPIKSALKLDNFIVNRAFLVLVSLGSGAFLVYRYPVVWFLSNSKLPYFYIFLCFGVLFVTGAIFSRKTFRVILVNLSLILFVFAGFEFSLSIMRPPYQTIATTRFENELYNRKSRLVGYEMEGNQQVTTRKYFDDKLVYEAQYTVGDNRFRITPQASEHAESSVIFVGCSFTFGEGLNDSETLPYQVGVRVKDQYQIYNFGVRGYGTHQIYAQTKHYLLQRHIQQPVKHIIYSSLYPEHARRAAGLGWWQLDSPRYKLSKNNQLEFCGNFGSSSFLSHVIMQNLYKSEIVSRIAQRKLSKRDKMLNSKLIIGIYELMQRDNPDAQMHILQWFEPYEPFVSNHLKDNGIKIHALNKVFDSVDNDIFISEKEYHPNKRVNTAIADYIITEILAL